MTHRQYPPQAERARARRPFSPLAYSAAGRLLVAAGVSLVLWAVVLWALAPQ